MQHLWITFGKKEVDFWLALVHNNTMMNSKGAQQMQTKQQTANAIYNSLARAKLVKVKKTGLFKLICAFNVYELNSKGEYKFPVEAKCNFVSGHINIEDVPRVMQQASEVLRTRNIELAA